LSRDSRVSRRLPIGRVVRGRAPRLRQRRSNDMVQLLEWGKRIGVASPYAAATAGATRKVGKTSFFFASCPFSRYDHSAHRRRVTGIAVRPWPSLETWLE